MMRLTTLLRRADPVGGADPRLSARGRAELRALVGPPATVGGEAPAAARRSSVHWRAAGLTVAVSVVAAIILVPSLREPGTMDAIPAQSPTPAAARGTWIQTAPSVLSGRRDALTAWVGGRFLIVGGYTDAPCKLGGTCSDQPRSDGALYDPARDTWTTISDAPAAMAQPEGSNPYARAVTVGDTVYAQGLNGAVLAYHSNADRWETLPKIPGDGIGTFAGSYDDQLVVFPWGQCAGPRTPCTEAETTSYWTYDPGSRQWVVHAVALRLPSSVSGASVVADDLVVAWLGSGKTLGSAVVNLRSEQVRLEAGTPVSQQRPVPAAAGRFAVWSRGSHTAWFLAPTTRTWSSVPQPSTPGPLSRDKGAVPITIGGLIALNGHLYDPATRLWSQTQALPIPTGAAVIVGGSDSALACYGYDVASESYNDTCYVLEPAPASQATP